MVREKCGQQGPSIAKIVPFGAQEASNIYQKGDQREAKWLPEVTQNVKKT